MAGLEFVKSSAEREDCTAQDVDDGGRLCKDVERFVGDKDNGSRSLEETYDVGDRVDGDIDEDGERL